MRAFRRNLCLSVMGLAALGGLVAALVSCAGSASVMSTGGTGTINVSITDPPSCQFPNGQLQHAYVTIRSVQAHTSANADDSTPGWQELAPQLNNQPMQVDLFAAGPNACLLTMLGSNAALPAGTYQQIRLLLVPNDGGTGPPPSSNACGDQGFNCVVLHDGSIHELLLSSQANTGLKIPPGQIVGGPITVAPGQDVDLNIDFNGCASILQEGNGQFRLKPVLKADQVSTNNTGISGQVVDGGTSAPLAGGTVLVVLEQQDNTGADVIFMQTAADADGHFNFCPLPTGAAFDVVAVGIDGAGVAYNATVAIGVPGGTNLGAIPLTAETGGPTTFQGFVTATTGSAPATIDVGVSAQQTINVGAGVTRPMTIPSEGNSTPSITVQSNSSCPITAPPDSNCAPYVLIEPASNPSVGVFSAGKIAYLPPIMGDVLYIVRADASSSSGSSDCMSPSIIASLDISGNPLKANPGATVTPKEVDFSGCT